MPLYNVVILFNKNYTNWNPHFVQVSLQHLRHQVNGGED
jgi:hypothetical protein